MPRLEFSERFVNDMSFIESAKLEARILENLDNIEMFGEFGSSYIPSSIKKDFGEGLRKVAVNPFDLIYTFYKDQDFVRVEALVHQRQVR